jgi:hypothetical protein
LATETNMHHKEGMMDKVISLLNEKNHYLEKFLELNERELSNFTSGNFDGLESFYHTRDRILDLIRCIDELIEEESTKPQAAVPVVTTESKTQISALLREKDNLVTEILSQDLQILSRIETEKSSIIKELQTVKKARKVFRAYHSGESRHSLDEEV